MSRGPERIPGTIEITRGILKKLHEYLYQTDEGKASDRGSQPRYTDDIYRHVDKPRPEE
jgi:hypothetical protein